MVLDLEFFNSDDPKTKAEGARVVDAEGHPVRVWIERCDIVWCERILDESVEVFWKPF